jgi:hypothetical protein
MASAAQIAANQSNAQASTGPRTDEGKARSSQNATTHGLTSRQFVIAPGQQQEFDTLHDSLLFELDPQGAVETVVFHDLLHAAWNLHRFRAIEAEFSSPDSSVFLDPQATAVLDRISRYHSRTQRAYYKALSELRILQTNRALRLVKLAPEDEPQVPLIADINQLTKQTQSEVKAQALEQALHMVEYETRTLVLDHMKKADIARAQKPAA